MMSSADEALFRKFKITQLEYGKKTKETALEMGMKPFQLYKIVNGFQDIPPGFERAFEELVSRWEIEARG